MIKKVLAYDVGGTKVEAAVINAAGQILDVERVPAAISQGKEAFLAQLAELGNGLRAKHPDISCIGIASAGPLHAVDGILLDPTNFRTDGQTWGKYPIVELVRNALNLPVHLQNDAAAAVMAEQWLGAAKGFQNSILITLGTGVGTGIIVNGKLVGAGRGLHTEGGHMIINWKDKGAKCGCGNYGCAEAYLSGKAFTARARKALRRPKISSQEVVEIARARKSKPLNKLVEEYASVMATLLHNFVMLYAPDIIVLAGSFSAAYPIFQPFVEEKLKALLQRRDASVKTTPDIKLSTLENHAGVLGAAYVALHS